MPEHTIETREEWEAARDELAKLERDVKIGELLSVVAPAVPVA